jgi:acyl-CoA reductase-like NAD-dependent aldehyde dehydrogenase
VRGKPSGKRAPSAARSARAPASVARRARTSSALAIANPATGSVILRVAADGPREVAEHYAAARAAQPRWAATPIRKRLAAIGKFRELVVARTDTLAHTLTQEVGKPIRQSRNELKGLLARLDFFIEESARALREEKVFADATQKLDERITHEPLGVVANISAWNYPYFVGSNVFIPALVAGNTVLYKPSEFATLTGRHIADLLHEAGIPDDVFVPVIGGGATGAALLRQPVDGVFFTGSYATGARIAAIAGKRMIKVQLELGGKDPVYVCDDVDVKASAAAIADGAFYNTGQSCCSVERIYVHESIHAPFVDAFVDEVKGYRVGDPLDETTYIGAITRRAQLDVLQRQVADAKRKGAKIMLGGAVIKRKGNWFAPTVLTDVDHSMLVMREESFGPIIGIQAVADDDAAIELMNDSEYGLTAGVYTPDEARARRVLARVQAGSVYWNCCDRVSPRLPWSGVKHSGIGLTLGTLGIQTFARPKAWHLRG